MIALKNCSYDCFRMHQAYIHFSAGSRTKYRKMSQCLQMKRDQRSQLKFRKLSRSACKDHLWRLKENFSLRKNKEENQTGIVQVLVCTLQQQQRKYLAWAKPLQLLCKSMGTGWSWVWTWSSSRRSTVCVLTRCLVTQLNCSMVYTH